MITLAQKETRMAAIRVANTLRYTAKGDWLARYDPEDMEYLPRIMELEFQRMGIVSYEEHPEGGYILTPLGVMVADELHEQLGEAA